MPNSTYRKVRRFLAAARLLLVCFLGVAFVHTAYAAIPDVVFTVGNVTSTYSDTIRVPIQVTDLTGDGVVSYQFQLTDNSSNISFVGIDVSGTLSSSGTVIDNPSANSTNVSGMFTSALSGSGTLLNILMVANSATTASITPSNVVFNTTSVTNLSSGTVTVQAPDNPPVISTINDITFLEDNSYTLDLTQYVSDPDDPIGSLTITAQVVSGTGLTINQDTQNHTLTFVPDANVYGSWDISLQVQDPGNLTASQTFTVNVTSVNDPPVLASVADQTMTEDDTLVVALSAQDPDGDNLTFSATSDVNEVQTSVSGTNLTLISSPSWIGTATITVTVSDGTVQQNTTFSVQVSHQFTAGDVDDNGLIQSYDAALTLQYSVGMDPLPQTDPRPWDNWRLTRADVDGNSTVAAYDASLIQQHVVGIIDQFPVETANPKTQPVQYPQDLTFNYVQNGQKLQLYINQTDYLYGVNIELLYDPAKVHFSTVDTTALSADYRYQVNVVNDNEVNLGMMIAAPPTGSGLFLSVGVNVLQESDLEVREVINAQDTVVQHIPLRVPTGVTNEDGVPVNYALHNNYPNPFNPTTNIAYDLPEQTYVTLGIYDILGRRIATLVNETQNGGRHIVQWNGKDDLGHKVGNGAYFYRIHTPKFNAVKKMVFLK